MQIVLAIDIFGHSRWSQDLVSDWQKQGHSVFVVSPYKERFIFSDEAEAYRQFTEEGGLDAYCQKVRLQLSPSILQQPTLFVGFSAGGSALWRVMSELTVNQDSHFIAFYPGQVRRYLNLTPNLKTSLIFPKLEQHFDLSAVIEYLVTNPKINVIQNTLLHGYANPKSERYDPLASAELAELLADVNSCLSIKQLNNSMLKMNFAHQVLTVE